MKKTGTYLLSLIVAVLLVFLMIGSTALLLVDINLTSSKLKSLAAKNKLGAKVCTEISKYYTDKYNTTGIPAEVYTDALDEAYIRSFVDEYIDSAFDALSNNTAMSAVSQPNADLEKSIEDFFNDFADKNNYMKDESFELKLQNTKESAYSTIGSFCDVYKFSAMNSKGLLQKASRVYSRRGAATAALLGFTTLMILLLVLINRKKKIAAMYWLGISAVVAGLIGTAPSLYFIASRYFDSFSIKQPAVFTAFTSAMYKYTEAFMAVNISLVVVGIALTVIYGFIGEKKKYPDTKPTQIE